MKKIPLILLMVCLPILLIGCSSNSSQGEDKRIVHSIGYPVMYKSIEDLTESADLIIEGTILGSRVEALDTASKPEHPDDPKQNPGGEIVHTKDIATVSMVEVNQVYKGDIIANDTIEVKQFGGETESIIMIDEKVTYLEKGKKYILFLSTYDNSPASLLNPYQGYYEKDGDNLIKHDENNLLLDLQTLENLS